MHSADGGLECTQVQWRGDYEREAGYTPKGSAEVIHAVADGYDGYSDCYDWMDLLYGPQGRDADGGMRAALSGCCRIFVLL